MYEKMAVGDDAVRPRHPDWGSPVGRWELGPTLVSV